MCSKFNLALITGASSGLGQKLAWLLAGQGIALILHGRQSEELSKLAAQLADAVPVSTLEADLSLSEGQALVATCIQNRQPDLIINNAGFGLYGPALDYTLEQQLSILKVNAEAAVHFSLAGARALKKSQKAGVIMNISSVSAFPVAPSTALYAASKALINHFSESFDEELRPYGIRVLVACPGVIRTNFRCRAAGSGASQEPYSFLAMPAEFAAQQIWQQILSGHKVRIFNWPYRVLVFLVKYLLPKQLVAKIMDRQIKRLRGKYD